MSKDAIDPGSLSYNPVRATDGCCRWAQSFPTWDKSLGLKTVGGLHHSTWLKCACAVWVSSMVERRGTARGLPWSLLMSSGDLLILGRTGQKSWEKRRNVKNKNLYSFSWNTSFMMGSSRKDSFVSLVQLSFAKTGASQCGFSVQTEANAFVCLIML